MLRTEDVTVRFGGLTAVNNVTLQAEKGKITGLIGPNGAGKTTLFNCVSGVQNVTAGKVFFNGEEITNGRGYKLCEQGIARTYQVINLFRELPVLDNVMIGHHCRIQYNFIDTILRTKRMRTEEEAARKDALQCLEQVNLLDKKDLRAGQLSYGEQRLLEIARALSSHPQILLLDEPAAGMNDTEKVALNTLLKRIIGMGVSIFIIEHDMQVIMKVSDYVYVMNDGKLLAEGDPEEIQNNPAVIEAYLGGE